MIVWDSMSILLPFKESIVTPPKKKQKHTRVIYQYFSGILLFYFSWGYGLLYSLRRSLFDAGPYSGLYGALCLCQPEG